MKTIIIIPARMASVRFPNKPMALINGKPIREFPLNSLRDYIGYVNQEPFLFSTTIRNNKVIDDIGAMTPNSVST